VARLAEKAARLRGGSRGGPKHRHWPVINVALNAISRRSAIVRDTVAAGAKHWKRRNLQKKMVYRRHRIEQA